MRSRIVYTDREGGVTVCCPSEDALRWMETGGRWDDQPRGFMDVQIERQIAAGHSPDAVRRFVHAMMFGGCTSAESLAIIRDRDCGHLGTGHELWDIDDLPQDYWFRDAWVRSHNGGPINISLNLAKPIQFQRIKHAVDTENHRRATDIERWDDPIEVDYAVLRDAIRRSCDVDDLRHIWPQELVVGA